MPILCFIWLQKQTDNCHCCHILLWCRSAGIYVIFFVLFQISYSFHKKHVLFSQLDRKTYTITFWKDKKVSGAILNLLPATLSSTAQKHAICRKRVIETKLAIYNVMLTNRCVSHVICMLCVDFIFSFHAGRKESQGEPHAVRMQANIFMASLLVQATGYQFRLEKRSLLNWVTEASHVLFLQRGWGWWFSLPTFSPFQLDV